MLLNPGTHRGGISIIYKALQVQQDKLPYTETWERILDREISKDEWYRRCNRLWKSGWNTSLLEANYKDISRWYLVPVRLADLYKGTTDECFRGCGL